LYRAGVLDEYFMGLMNQVAQAMDDSVTQEVSDHYLLTPKLLSIQTIATEVGTPEFGEYLVQ
jgi:hypothetical protein